MNNYNYYDTFSNSYANQNNQINDDSMLFGAYEGYLKGNLFKDLYEQYKNYTPATIRPTSEKEQELFNLNQVAFAMHDLNLYLDIYPNDRNMLNTFMEYQRMYKNILENYEQKYGPINVTDVDGNIPFSWESKNFPWEVK